MICYDSYYDSINKSHKTWAKHEQMVFQCVPPFPRIPADVGNRHTQRFPGDGRCDVWVGSLMRPEPIQDTLATVRIASQPGPSWTVHTIARNKTNMCNTLQQRNGSLGALFSSGSCNLANNKSSTSIGQWDTSVQACCKFLFYAGICLLWLEKENKSGNDKFNAAREPHCVNVYRINKWKGDAVK